MLKLIFRIDLIPGYDDLCAQMFEFSNDIWPNRYWHTCKLTQLACKTWIAEAQQVEEQVMHLIRRAIEDV